MARETVAERKARLEQLAQEEREREQATYPARLMEVLERASRVRFELTVRDSQFRVTQLNDEFMVVLTLEYTPESNYELDELRYRLNDIEEQEADAARREMVRRAALSKLSQEERELLGL
jgi:hypothetical protein